MNGTAQMVNKASLDAAGPRHTSNARLAREFRTIKAMVHIYCRDHHGQDFCDDCQGLMDYASLRLERCRFGAEKPTCARCPVHCYQRNRRCRFRQPGNRFSLRRKEYRLTIPRIPLTLMTDNR
jgi:hypothetical protein